MKLVKMFAVATVLVATASCSNSSSTDSVTTESTKFQTTTLPESEEFPPWGVVPPPPVPTVTDPVPEIVSTTTTGVYWAEAVPLIGDENNTVVFVLSQFFSGEECIKYVVSIGIDPEDGDACPNNYTVRTEPSAFMAIAEDATVTVTYVDTQQSKIITTAILRRLVRGDEPMGTPIDFDYTPFPFVVSTINGVIVSAQQVWVS
jgi:hypothetical protein